MAQWTDQWTNQGVDQWRAFLGERWYYVVIAAVVLFIVIKLVKTVVKWLLVIAIIAAILLYGANYKGDLPQLGNEITTGAKNVMISTLAGDAADATYQQNRDGTFTITTKRLNIEGELGSDQIKVTFLSQSFHVQVDDTIRRFIADVKERSLDSSLSIEI